MTQPSYTTFKGIENYSDVQLLTEIENNLKSWLDWSLLSIGAWTDVKTTGGNDGYGGSPSQLNWSNNLSYNSGQVWQSARKDWVWESGIDYSGHYPINITGISITGIGITGVMTTGYYVNYPLGCVIFTNSLPTGSKVTCNYSYKDVQIYKADDVPWWRELEYNSTPDNIQFKQDPRTGDWSIGAYHRIQLPTIILEAVSRGNSRGYEIGNGSLVVEQDVLFHILADNRITRNNLLSMLFLQNDKIIYLYNTNNINKNHVFPLDYRGTIINNLTYPDLVSETGYRWKKCHFTRTSMSEVQSIHPSLYEGVVRSTLEIVFGDI